MNIKKKLLSQNENSPEDGSLVSGASKIDPQPDPNQYPDLMSDESMREYIENDQRYYTELMLLD